MSRKCRAIAAYKRGKRNGELRRFVAGKWTQWPIRKAHVRPYNPVIPTSKRLTPCEWRRFYRRNPLALYNSQKATRDPHELVRTVYGRHLTSLNLMPEFGPMNRPPKDGP